MMRHFLLSGSSVLVCGFFLLMYSNTKVLDFCTWHTCVIIYSRWIFIMNTIRFQGIGAVSLISGGMAPNPYGKSYSWWILLRMKLVHVWRQVLQDANVALHGHEQVISRIAACLSAILATSLLQVMDPFLYVSQLYPQASSISFWENQLSFVHLCEVHKFTVYVAVCTPHVTH
jgi:hypothetical protein